MSTGIGFLCRWSSSQAQEAALHSPETQWQLMSAVSLERLPLITTPMNHLEKDVSAMLTQIEMEYSSLSDHELRHLDDV